MGGLSRKIGGSQQNGSVGLGLLFEELTRCSLFNYIAQPHKLIYAMIWPYVTPTFKIVHRCGADRAQNAQSPSATPRAASVPTTPFSRQL
jgi:hypothetical protein